MCFPFAAQAARVYRKIGKHKPETVYLISSRPAEQMDAQQWLKANRQYWGIESGTHQRLDVTANEDRCRVRTPNAVLILGMFRRLAISLFVEWRSRDPKRKWVTLTDFYGDMARDGHRRGFLLVSTRRPSSLGRAS